MKFYALILTMLLSGSIVFAQNDPVLMTIGGRPVTRSEFEYAYLKNNPQNGNEGIAMKDFLKQFVNYKLKVRAALDAKVDTTANFKQAFSRCWSRAVPISVPMVSSGDREVSAHKIYQEMQKRIQETGGCVKLAHILLRLDQKASSSMQGKLKNKADSLFALIQNGADFAGLAKRFSDDKATAVCGGKLPWIAKGQTSKSFENMVFSMKKGEVSQPFLTEFGYEIVRLDDKQDDLPYDSVKTDICRYLDAKDLRDRVMDNPSAEESTVQLQNVEDEQKITTKDKETENLIREYYDGLLVYEMSKRSVWAKAAQDEAGQAAYFAKNKKKYRWVQPRMNGKRRIKGPRDYKEVQSLVIADYQDKMEKEWVETLKKKYPVEVNEEVLATVSKK